jgi:hypothetical protein
MVRGTGGSRNWGAARSILLPKVPVETPDIFREFCDGRKPRILLPFLVRPTQKIREFFGVVSAVFV